MREAKVPTFRFLAAVCGVLCGVLLAGCSGSGGHVLGVAPTGEPKSIADAQSAAKGTPIVLKGEMVEKCPAAGCWFILRDQKGTMKIDLAAAKFVVVDVPLHSTMTVTGKVAGSGDGRFLDASGLQY